MDTRTHAASRLALCALALAALLALAAASAAAQAGAGGTQIFGDVTINEGKAEGHAPLSYDIILYYEDGRIHSRQRVANGGRYRFFGVKPGTYDIVVEVEGQEVARLSMNIGVAGTAPDFRKDIELEWKPGATAAGGHGRKQTVSAADFYDRPAANRSNFERAQAATDKKKYDEAAALLKLVVEADDKDFQAWTELGTVELLRGDRGEAEKAYRRAIAERPTFALAQLNLGRLLAGQKKYEEAIEPLTRALEAQPDSAEANLLLGEAYLQLKKGSKAVPYLNEAARLGKSEAHLRLATLYNAAGLKERAAAEYEQLLAKEPNHPDRQKLEKYISENKKSRQ